MSVEALKKQPVAKRRKVTVLGSTGSIGVNTIDLLKRDPGLYDVVALTAYGNVELLIEQARALKPQLAVIGKEAMLPRLEEGLKGTGIDVAAGPKAIVTAAELPSDWVMAAIIGAAGLEPALAAAKRGAIVALANKETLVCAGELFKKAVAEGGATLLPVDSEHNAIFQVFDAKQSEHVSRIILTASGGPFRTWKKSEMGNITPEQAVAHPNWDMGAKISVASATLMNKGLEYIEAYHLFPVAQEQIEILVHPQSVIHSMVEYCDGSVLAQLGSPDMRTPIGYALGWPQRVSTPSPKLNLAEIGSLTFEEPDTDRFPAIICARDALREGGAMPTIMNAANEVAIASFLNCELAYLDMVTIVRETMEKVDNRSLNAVADVLEVDRQSRAIAQQEVSRRRLN